MRFFFSSARSMGAAVTGMVFASAALALQAPAANPSAASKIVDCSALKKYAGNQTNQLDPSDVEQCIRRGSDLPVAWRPANGKSAGTDVGGASGVYNANANPPAGSPGARGMPASVDKNRINFACNFPPRISFNGFKPKVSLGACGNFLNGLFNDKNNEPASSATAAGAGAAAAAAAASAGTSVADGACPVESDTTGAFGASVSLSKGATPLVCGGAMPLSSYEMSLNANATHLAGTEHGARYLWVYQNSGGSFQQLGGAAIKLPANFGTWNLKTKTCDNQVATPVPIAQMITYNAGASELILRVVQSADFDNNSSDEKFLVLPLSGGMPQIPAECSPAANYIKTTLPQPDLRIASAAGLCEGTAEQCALEGISVGASLSCDVVTLHTSGITNTNAGGVDCTGRTQMAVISRPNLLFPPGTTPSVVPITGRTAVMVTTVAGSDIYVPSDTLINVGAKAPSFVLPEGGSMLMKDDSKLVMSPGVTIQGGGGQALLANGGQLLRADGSLVTEFPAGATVAANNPILPLTIKANRSIGMPAGYLVPTQPSPYVRLPAEGPK